MSEIRESARRLGAWAERLVDPPDRVGVQTPLTRLLDGATARSRQHPQLMDSAVALVVLICGLLSNAGKGQGAVALIFTFLLALPLAGRRRAPTLVFLFIGVVAFAQWLDGVPLFADTALLIALYGVAVSRPPRVAMVATALVETGALLATLRWPGGGAWLEPFALLSGAIVAAAILGVHMQARQAYVAGLLERAERLQFERDQQAQIAAAAERARIAREMHDMVAHSLAVVISLANGAKAKLHRDPEQSREALDSITELGSSALDDIRRLLSVLRTDRGGDTLAPQPGVDEIPDLVEQAAATGLRTSLKIDGAPAPLASGSALSAYRIVQEAITNTLKHADHATALTVALTWSPHSLQIAVEDDGRVAARRPDLARGYGLAGMRERASLCGGAASGGPGERGGWSVRATIPTSPTSPTPL